MRITPNQLLSPVARRRQYQEVTGGPEAQRRGVPLEALADPSNLESDLAPSDLKDNRPWEPTELDKAAVKLVQERFQAAKDAKKDPERRYRESLAYVSDDQWVEWDVKAGKLKSLATDRHRTYPVFNVMKPRTRKLRTRALTSKIEISISPLTGRKEDILATRQGRGLISHFELLHDEDEITARAVNYCINVGPIASMVHWDKHKVVPMPVFSEDPMSEEEIERIIDFAAGEVADELIGSFELFPDPKATRWEDIEWIIHAKERSLEYIQTKYPERGRYVGPGDRSGVMGLIHDLVDKATGRESGTSKNTETVVALHAKPNAVYPRGLYIVIAGDVLLYPTEIDTIAKGAGNLPYPKCWNPFTILEYEKGIEQLWGNNGASCMISGQRVRNRLLGRIEEHTNNGDGKMLVERGIELDKNAFKTGIPNEVIFWTRSNPNQMDIAMEKPQIIPTPQIDPTIPALINQIDADLDMVSEVNDPSRGVAPSADASGELVAMLIEQDQSTNVLFAEAIKTWKVERYKKKLALAAQFYVTERLVMVQDSAPETPVRNAMMDAQGQMNPSLPPEMQEQMQGLPPEIAQLAAAQGAPEDEKPLPAPRMEAQAFENLAEGRFVITATVAQPKSPAVRVQMILDMAKAGMFLPEALPTTIVMLEQLEITQSDKLTTDLLLALQKMQAREDEQAALQAETQSSIEEQKLATQQALGEQKLQQDLAAGQQKMEMQAQIDQQKLGLVAQTEEMKLGFDVQREQVKGEAEIAKAQAKTLEIGEQGKLDLAQAEHKHALDMELKQFEAELNAQGEQGRIQREHETKSQDREHQAKLHEQTLKAKADEARIKADTARRVAAMRPKPNAARPTAKPKGKTTRR